MIDSPFLHLSFRCTQGADASHNSWLLPSERGCQMPNRQLDPLHPALQQGWEEAWGGPTLQVRKAIWRASSGTAFKFMSKLFYRAPYHNFFTRGKNLDLNKQQLRYQPVKLCCEVYTSAEVMLIMYIPVLCGILMLSLFNLIF